MPYSRRGYGIKSHTYTVPVPAAGRASPGGGGRNAGLQPRPATTHRPTQGVRNNQNENQTKKHTPKSRAPPRPSPKPELLIPATLPPKNKPKLFFFCSFFLFVSFYFFFSKVLGFFGLQVADQLGSLSSLPLCLPSGHHPWLLPCPPHPQPQDGTAKLVRSPRGWTEDMRPGKIRFLGKKIEI